MKINALIAIGALACIAAPGVAQACCPTGGGGAPLAESGLGEQYPATVDLAPNSEFAVYGFERDGVRYVQVNAPSGNVLLAVGYIGDTLWSLPVGEDIARVRLPGDALPSGPAVEVYRSPEIVIRRYETADGGVWSVESSAR